MQQYKGGSMQADAVFEATKKQKEAGKACVQVVDEQMMMPFEKLSDLSPACYEDNSKDDNEEWKESGTSNAPQGPARARKWDRLKDAEECIVEMAGENGPAVRSSGDFFLHQSLLLNFMD
ncbi:hypothetical protein DUNSADRAFT_2057 [Dunaliella salina]|uniref:Encoded protein n=1 Tax=Dunaliella salina TaxID=3046 RepID=A0ABQ7FWQ1_DUNSA|nr:hypothetical protein DUNSADRAFT_2057 [Dunaliella salina]|eukprot:KAF5826790.1 hypothetical protein DUNSADRAFT_2057 [Dunaliella salina]